MVILLGGVSCSGKTLMAQTLLEKYKISYISIDHIKMGLIKGNTNCGFNATDKDEVIAEKIWPIIKGIIMTCIENKQNIIIEGCYLLPKYIKDLKKEYLNEIISLFIVFSSNYINNNYNSGIIKYRNEIENRMYEEDRQASFFIKEHNKLKSQCIDEDVDFIEIKSNYEEEIEKVYKFVEDKMKSIIE